MPSATRNVDVNGGTLFAEAIGLSLPRTAVLLAGAAMQATAWESEFISTLNAHDVGVVRFDWRDIGKSTWKRFKDSPYSIEDLTEDVMAVTEAFGLASFHLVGFSMGGCVAQLAAVAHPGRVKSLSLVSSGFASRIELPRSERSAALFEILSRPRPTSDEEHAGRLVDQWRSLCGRSFDFDEAAWTERARAWVQRGQNPSCPHLRLGPQVFGVERTEALAALDLPVTVIHGTDDPMFPHAHGEAIVRAIPLADLRLVDGAGHELYLDLAVAKLIGEHISSVVP